MKERIGRGFTLIEMLVVIGIISVLISILLPVLNQAREAANQIKCASNLRNIGQAVAVYMTENSGALPNSFTYKGMGFDNSTTPPTQTPDPEDQGYVHWSWLLFEGGAVKADAFKCPSLDKGGLPASNPDNANFDAGQVADVPGVVDEQAPRMGYTLNEALCGRNKFVVGYQDAKRVNQYISAARVRNSSGTILATEFINNWRIVSDAGRDVASAVSKSHRPVHGFVKVGAVGTEGLGMAEHLAVGDKYRQVTVDDLDPDPIANYSTGAWTAATYKTRLDWVGRNHGGEAAYADRKSNFLYLDGHVESKSIKGTLTPKFEWGDSFYTMSPDSGL